MLKTMKWVLILILPLFLWQCGKSQQELQKEAEQIQKIEDLEKEVETQKEEYAKKEGENQELKEQVEVRQKNLDDVSVRLEENQVVLDKILKDHETLKNEKGQLEKQHEATKKELEQLKSKSTAQEKALADANKKAADSQKQVADTQKKLTETEKSLADTKKEKDALLAENNKIKKEQADKGNSQVQENKALQEQIAQKDTQIASLQTQITSLKEELGQIKTQEQLAEEKIEATQKEIAETLKEEIENYGIVVEKVDQIIMIHMAEQLFFSRGDIDVSKGGKDILERVGSVLAKLEDKVIWVEGHSDDDPIVSPSLKRKYKTNWELSAARATNVVRFFQEQCKIDPLKLIAAGMGQYRPRYSNEDRATKAKNRRIEISILNAMPKKEQGEDKEEPQEDEIQLKDKQEL